VRDADGRPLPAKVAITDSAGHQVPAWFQSAEEDGGSVVSQDELPAGPCWVEPVLPPGEYDVAIDLEGYGPQRKRVHLGAGRPEALDVVLERSR
jgi:hypothetical protein